MVGRNPLELEEFSMLVTPDAYNIFDHDNTEGPARRNTLHNQVQAYFDGKRKNSQPKNTNCAHSYIPFSDKDSVRPTSIPGRSFNFNNNGRPNGETSVTNGPHAWNWNGNAPRNDSVRPTYNPGNSNGYPIGETVVASNGIHVINWNGNTPITGGENETIYTETGEALITVKLDACTKLVGLDGSPEAIKDAIKSAFGLRSKQAFWLVDEDGVVRPIDRDMPLTDYTLHLDKGLTIKVCLSGEPNHSSCIPLERTFYAEYDLFAYLRFRGWTAMKGSSGNIIVDSLEGLKPDEVYHGLR